MDKIYLSRFKKKAKSLNAALVFEDEASFRQDSTLHATWSKIGQQPSFPVTGARKSVKIFGCVDIFSAKFLYRKDDIFNADKYLEFLDQIAKSYTGQKVFLIQDNASYHKSREVWDWFKDNRKWLTVTNLPPYSPEYNAAEPLWKHTRRYSTHNRYFETKEELIENLEKMFLSIQKSPTQIIGYLRPFL